MIIESPVPSLLTMREYTKEQRSRPLLMNELAGYECDNVVITRSTGRILSPDKKGILRLELTFVLKARAGVDKLVGATAEVIVAGTPIAKKILSRIDVEEGKTAIQVLSVGVRASDLPEGSEPILRLTVTVDDNP
jgi:hypothetical protein